MEDRLTILRENEKRGDGGRGKVATRESCAQGNEKARLTDPTNADGAKPHNIQLKAWNLPN